MSAADDNVYARKKEFIGAQVDLLSEEPRVSDDLIIRLVEDGGLSEASVATVLYKLDLAIRKHVKVHYSMQGIRHTASQIDHLYAVETGAVDQGPILDGETDELLLLGHADYRKANVINRMPAEWPGSTENGESDEYMTQLAELRTRSHAYTAVYRKYMAYKELHTKLADAFAEPEAKIQPSLIHRGSDMATEIDRTRILTAKVSERLASVESLFIQREITSKPRGPAATSEDMYALANNT